MSTIYLVKGSFFCFFVCEMEMERTGPSLTWIPLHMGAIIGQYLSVYIYVVHNDTNLFILQVCAPLWVNTYHHYSGSPDYRPQGRCYNSPRNLTGFEIIQTCSVYPYRMRCVLGRRCPYRMRCVLGRRVSVQDEMCTGEESVRTG